MRRLLTLFALAVLAMLFSCTTPSGNDVTQYYEAPSGYYKLDISDGIVVTVSDNVNEIVVTGDEKVLEKLTIQCTAGCLRIYRRDVSLVYVTTTEITLPFEPNLKEVLVNMDSEFHTDYGIEGETCRVKVDQRSKFHGYVLADELKVTVSDHSEATIAYDVANRMDVDISEYSEVDFDGYVPDVHMEMSGSSKIYPRWDGDYYAFHCDYLYGTMDDNCVCYVDCESEIAMHLTNYCTLYYTGWPYVEESTIDGSSEFVESN